MNVGQACPPGRLTRIACFDVPEVVEGVYYTAVDTESFRDFLVRACRATPMVVQAPADGNLGVSAVA